MQEEQIKNVEFLRKKEKMFKRAIAITAVITLVALIMLLSTILSSIK